MKEDNKDLLEIIKNVFFGDDEMERIPGESKEEYEERIINYYHKKSNDDDIPGYRN